MRQIEKDLYGNQYFKKLRKGVWFGRLPESLALTVFKIGHVVEYNVNETIYSEGQPHRALMAIIDGTAHCETFDRDGRRVLICAGGPGAWFGEIAESPLREASLVVRAYRPCKVWNASAVTLKRLLREQPDLVESMNEFNAMRLGLLIEMVCVAQRPTAMAQVAGRLALISRLYRESNPELQTPVIYASQADLADMTGHSRQTINAIVAQLEKDQLIKVGHRRIEILDTGKLDAFGDIAKD